MDVDKLFVLIYSNADDNAKRYKAQRCYLPKRIIKSYDVIINGNNFHDQLIGSDVKRYKKKLIIRKLTTRQDKDYVIGCLLDCDYIKNHYRLIAVDMSRQKELDADGKATLQTKFVRQLKNTDSVYADGT